MALLHDEYDDENKRIFLGHCDLLRHRLSLALVIVLAPALFYVREFALLSTRMGIAKNETQQKAPAQLDETEPLLQASSAANDICSRLPTGLSRQHLWELLLPHIRNASLPKDITELQSLPIVHEWLEQDLMVFQDFTTLQRSMLQPPPLAGMEAVLDILNQTMRNPHTAAPLQIMVFGGSVTQGGGCDKALHLANVTIKKTGGGMKPSSCSWPLRLQDLFDSIFPGMIQVVNMGMGGCSSEISRFIIENMLWPEGYPVKGPDVLVWDHGINDAAFNVDIDTLYETLLEPFFDATKKLQCHRKELPLPIYMDSFLGLNDPEILPTLKENFRVSSIVYQLITWRGVMGISYANSLRHHVMSRWHPKEVVPFLGTPLEDVHPGLMYHVSIAWVFFFNFLASLTDACSSRQHHFDTHTNSQDLIPKNLPPLDGALVLKDIPTMWQSSTEQEQTACDKKRQTPMQSPCEYIWAVNRMTGTRLPKDVEERIEPFLIANHGWSARGKDGHPRIGIELRPGWLPDDGPGSWFEMTIPIVHRTVDSFTVIAMKSYSNKWVDSLVQLNVTVQGQQETDPVLYQIGGYQATKTSVLFTHKFTIPQANPGSNVTARFELLSGKTAKIAGMALCSA